MKTKIHTYFFNLANASEREPYHQLKTRLDAEVKAGKRGHCLNVIAMPNNEERTHQSLVKAAEAAGLLTLETEHLFCNQWNSVEAGRVFDWYEGINHEDRLLKFGHWLEITPEMDAIRRDTLKCGYTGQQFPASSGMAFNTTARALGSCYLKEEALHLLRLVPVFAENESNPRAKLTEAEREYLLPLYLAAQTKTQGEARAKQRAVVEAEFAKDTELARMEYEGKLWLLDHGVNLENVIFYTHTARFSFGWRNAYGKAAARAMRKALEGFPFAFDIKEEGGK